MTRPKTRARASLSTKPKKRTTEVSLPKRRAPPPIAVAVEAPPVTTGLSRAERYVDQVLDGTVPACEEVRLACERHLKDLQRAKSDAFPYRFDQKKAERVVRMVEKLPHVKGEWARADREAGKKLLVLEDWECFIYCMIFGWVEKKSGWRRFNKARIYVPRKNGKSCGIAAPIGLYMFALDDEPGAEVYSGASSQKQAWEVFGPALTMVQRTPQLVEKADIVINARSMVRISEMAKFEPIIGKPGDGASPHCSITDEYHEHDTDDQVVTMETGMGARTQPLSLIVSTAGSNIAGPCFEDWERCKKILRGVIEDDATFCIIYTITPPKGQEDTFWATPLALRMANPNYGVSVGEKYPLQQLKRAQEDARFQSAFKTKHLNLWVQSRNAYINVQKWMEQCLQPKLSLKMFKGKRCWLGLDLASKNDLCALVLLFRYRDGYAVFGRYYLPRKTVDKPEHQHYQKWEKEKSLCVTEGDITDYEYILEDIVEACETFEVGGIGYDPAQATMLVNKLTGKGLPVVEYAPTVLNFSEPMKQIEAHVSAGKIAHNGNGVMDWAMSNVTAKSDRKDNVYPTKEVPGNKIDPFVALCMAMGLAMQEEGKEEEALDDFVNNPVMVTR
jgi:phage terminase large subunit-like protein